MTSSDVQLHAEIGLFSRVLCPSLYQDLRSPVKTASGHAELQSVLVDTHVFTLIEAWQLATFKDRAHHRSGEQNGEFTHG